MKITINLYDFLEAFRKAERMKFTREGLIILFKYLEELERDTGEEIELDVIALCREYAESSYKDICRDYGLDVECCAAEKYLSDNTVIIGSVDGRFIYQEF